MRRVRSTLDRLQEIWRGYGLESGLKCAEDGWWLGAAVPNDEVMGTTRKLS